MPTIFERARRAWDALVGKDPPSNGNVYYFGSSSTYRPDRHRYSRQSAHSIMAPLLSRIAVDCAGMTIKHVRVDDKGRYVSDVEDELNDVFNLSANIDQSGRAFLKDLYSSLLDEGCIAIVPIRGELNEQTQNLTTITDVRVGKVKNWYPKHVEVEVYNDDTGQHETIKLHKNLVAICENPFYEIMNEPNSLAQRLRRKLVLLDQMDEQTASGKLDMIIQLPYTTRSEARKKQAELRKQEIEVQLAGSKYGVAYTDASEKIVQLNRSLDNNLAPQIEKLEKQLENQLGIGEEILNGTATEQQLLNYSNNILEPIVSTVVAELKRKFLTKNARSRFESIMAFRDPFRLVPLNNIAEIVDKLKAAEVLSANEIRGILGMEPSDDPKSDQLINPNVNPTDPNMIEEEEMEDIPEEEYANEQYEPGVP